MAENKKSRRKEPIKITIFFGLIWIAAVIELVILWTTIDTYCFQDIGVVYLVFAGSLTLTPILLQNLWKSLNEIDKKRYNRLLIYLGLVTFFTPGLMLIVYLVDGICRYGLD